MIIAAATQKMMDFYKGNIHDIAHFLKVWALAKTIGELEGLTHKQFWSLLRWCMILPVPCAGKNTAIQPASTRSWKVRRWWRRFLRKCLSRAACGTHFVAGCPPSYLLQCGWTRSSDSAGSGFSGECRREQLYTRGNREFPPTGVPHRYRHGAAGQSVSQERGHPVKSIQPDSNTTGFHPASRRI